MAIVDNEGKQIDVTKLEDVIIPPVEETPASTWNDGKAVGGEIGEDGKVIQKPDEEEKPDDIPKEEVKTVSFTKPGEDDLTLPGEKSEDGAQVDAEQTEFYKGLGGILEDKGLIKMGDTPFQTEEDFVKAYESEINSRLSERNKTIEDYMNAGIPFSAVNKIEKAITSADAITEEAIENNPKLAKDLIMSEFSNRGFDEATASRYYDMFKESGKVTTEAMNALNLRKATLSGMLQTEIDQAKANKTAALKKEDQLAVDLVKGIESGSVLDRTITASTQDKLKKVLNTVVGYTESGQPLNAVMKYKMENPVDFEKNLLYLYTVTNGFSDLKSLDRSAESRVSRQFKNAVTHISSGKSFTEKSSTPNKTLIDIDSIDDIV